MTRPLAPTDTLQSTTVPPPEAGDLDLWTEVHEQVQQHLAILAGEVRRRLNGTRVQKGRTNGERFCLFSYCTFSTPDFNLDPVVAGMIFTLANDTVTVDADLSGEHTGDCISSLERKTVANRRAEILAAASEFGRKLAELAEPIVAALQDRSRKAD